MSCGDKIEMGFRESNVATSCVSILFLFNCTILCVEKDERKAKHNYISNYPCEKKSKLLGLSEMRSVSPAGGRGGKGQGGRKKGGKGVMVNKPVPSIRMRHK